MEEELNEVKENNKTANDYEKSTRQSEINPS